MKIYTKLVLQLNPLTEEYECEESVSFDYTGPLALALGGAKEQTTTTAPPAYALPNLQNVQTQANTLYDSGQLGQVAAQDPATLQAYEQLKHYLPQLQGQLINPAFSTAGNILTNATDVYNNPALANAATAAIRPLETSLLQNVLPQIRTDFGGAGQYGGSRQALATGQSVDAFTRNAGDITSRMFSDAYGQGLQAQLGVLGLSPQLAKLGTMPGTILSGIGADQQQYEQQKLNAPANALQQYMQFISGSTSGGTTTAPGPTANPIGSALGGAAIGASIPGAGGLGAGLGALAGFLSAL